MENRYFRPNIPGNAFDDREFLYIYTGECSRTSSERVAGWNLSIEFAVAIVESHWFGQYCVGASPNAQKYEKRDLNDLNKTDVKPFCRFRKIWMFPPFLWWSQYLFRSSVWAPFGVCKDRPIECIRRISPCGLHTSSIVTMWNWMKKIWELSPHLTGEICAPSSANSNSKYKIAIEIGSDNCQAINQTKIYSFRQQRPLSPHQKTYEYIRQQKFKFSNQNSSRWLSWRRSMHLSSAKRTSRSWPSDREIIVYFHAVHNCARLSLAYSTRSMFPFRPWNSCETFNIFRELLLLHSHWFIQFNRRTSLQIWFILSLFSSGFWLTRCQLPIYDIDASINWSSTIWRNE